MANMRQCQPDPEGHSIPRGSLAVFRCRGICECIRVMPLRQECGGAVASKRMVVSTVIGCEGFSK
eukprot:scaffold179526_cov19-Tisochrysis_lutea.AAC.1